MDYSGTRFSFARVQEKTARPCSPSEEYQDTLSVNHEAQKGADIGGIILLNEQVDNGSAPSSNFLPLYGEGESATNGGVGDAQMSNATDVVPEEKMESERGSSNISGSERLSLMTRTLPASETEVGNLESQNLPNHGVRNERSESEGVSNNISRSERLSLWTRTSPTSAEEGRKFETKNVPDQEVRNETATEEVNDEQMRKAKMCADEDKVEEEDSNQMSPSLIDMRPGCGTNRSAVGQGTSVAGPRHGTHKKHDNGKDMTGERMEPQLKKGATKGGTEEYFSEGSTGATCGRESSRGSPASRKG